MRLSELGELGLLRELERRGLAQRIGDDGAVLGDGRVATQDVLVEGIHFRPEWTSWRDLGYKAAAVNLSDLAAMAAEPEALLVTLAAPRETEADDVLELYEGLNEPGVPLVGGDTSAGPVLTLGVTALGRSERVPGRGGARPGDALIVTGPLGGSAAGLRVLELSLPGFEELVRMHNRPPIRTDVGLRLGPVAHALMDLSDGIASDAERIAEQSGCKLVIEVERLPVAPRLAEVGDEPFWAFGEDYELLAALATGDADSSGFAIVGRCEEGAGAELRLEGRAIQVDGWSHFSGD